MNKVEFTNSALIVLIIFMLLASNPAVSGWFGYDTRTECFSEEQGKLMSRWINPLSPKDARIAAKLLCRKYPTRDEVYVKKLKSMSITELREERKQTLEIQRKFNSKTSFLYEYSGHDIKIIDAELQRRRH